MSSPDPSAQPSEEAKLPDSDDLAEYVVATWITTTNGPKGDRMTFFPAVRAQLVSLVAIAMREVSAQALERAAGEIPWRGRRSRGPYPSPAQRAAERGGTGGACPDTGRQVMSEREAVIASMEPLLKRAEIEGLYLHCSYQDIWYSPEELRAEHANNRMLWGAVNWTLRDPAEHTASLANAVVRARKDLDAWLARIK